jgi:predicted flap endonuclease-1-like 5' DNA nuclease
MNEYWENLTCRSKSWHLAGAGAFVLFLVFTVLFGWSFFLSLLLAALCAAAGGIGLSHVRCGDEHTPDWAKPILPKAPDSPADRPAAPAAPMQARSSTSVVEDVKPAAAASQAAAKPAAKAPAAKATAAKAPAAKAAAKPAAAKAKPAAGAKTTATKAAAKPAKAAAGTAKPAATPAASSGPKKPRGLTAARGGKADDLKRIKGVGPKLEKLLNGMGYYHFDQIAAWGAGEVAWVDDNLEGFKGRVSRDAWVDQAKTLAAGGDTEFSRRVGKGEVY